MHIHQSCNDTYSGIYAKGLDFGTPPDRRMTHGTLPEYVDEMSKVTLKVLLTSIDDIILHHLLPRLSSFLLINPGRLVPVIMRDKTEFDIGIGQSENPPKGI